MNTNPDRDRRETVEYFVQCQQPDGTWEQASSTATDLPFATDRLAARRKMQPEFTFRLAQRNTIVVVQPLADCPSCEAGVEHTEHCPTPETHNWGCGCPSDVAAAIASCPGYEMSPSPCRCPCEGCKHHCAAHNPDADEARQPEPEAEPTAEEIARANVLALHQIGEQLAGIESWMWEHLADVREAAKAQPAVSGLCVAGEQQNETPEAETPTCPDREPLIGVQCSKESGHEGPHSDRPGRIWYPVPAAEALDPRPEPDEPDEPASTCTCGDAGDAFVPLGHYRDCPDAAGAQPE